ncbi:hypothetical protein G6F60_013975 [Rhizopus arrhizus]|nr:hypothetical protein G6F60_013975 [Rhizopus arrhizus]
MNVIWSDETKVNRLGSDGKSYAWKVPGKPLKKHQVRETVKHGGGCIMVWSCISWYGPGYIVDVGKCMTKDVYLEVLQDDLMESLALYMEESRKTTNQFIFMQDNDPKHTAKVVSKWLNEQEFHDTLGTKSLLKNAKSLLKVCQSDAVQLLRLTAFILDIK